MVSTAITTWLKTVLVLIVLIIGVGAITRLTGSGLSIVEWRPVMGVLPPLSHQEWQGLFEQYQQFPQYKIENSSMNLSGFKEIFFWEYLHRILGRLIGLSIIVPFLYFLIRGKLNSYLKRQTLVMIVLVLAQGFMGWYMVKSGLVDRPSVSHFRLAAHLFLALLLLSYILWTLLSLRIKESRKGYLLIKSLSVASILSLAFQLLYGAFTAGLKAGFLYNTYPKMGDVWIPKSLFIMGSFMQDMLHNPFMVQFIHRHFAIAVVIMILLTYFTVSRSDLPKKIKLVATLLFGFVLCQFILGILTLLSQVNTVLALGHQLLAVLLLTYLLYLIHLIYYTPHD
jgi:cytochrome c oxidase assembly protein subunit 15